MSYRKFLTFYCLLLVALTAILIVLVMTGDCVLGDACNKFAEVSR